MLKTIALGSALALVPVLALADESTAPPSPYTEKAPGNGPNLHRYHQWRRDRNNMVEQRSAAVNPGGYRQPYRDEGVWSGPSYSPYGNMYPPPPPATAQQ
jgi:2-polyprenyl-6-methoxyphenol hydroxylase-like FAD-dependent oxidoreductase